MEPKKLSIGDTIGIISPCSTADKDIFKKYISGLEKLGFKIKESRNLYKSTYGYSASEKERADDFNEMVADKTVKAVMFEGGDVGNGLIPYIDFEALKNNPKIFCSYSNGTTLLNAIHSMTGLTVYYGQSPSVFAELSFYNYKQFKSNLIDESVKTFETNHGWTCRNGGHTKGYLIGGYSTLVALMLGSRYFSYDKDKHYILFIENHEAFCAPGEISEHLAHIEQHEFMKNVKGLIFGHYSDKDFPEISHALERFGKRNNIPVISCHDFGHGLDHAIFPIGKEVDFDADNGTLTYL